MSSTKKLVRHPENVMKKACMEVIVKGRSKKSVSEEFGIPRRTIRRYLAKCEGDLENITMNNFKPNYSVNRIFNDQEEQKLCDYLIESAKHHFGFSNKNVRKLAYELAIKYDKEIPEAWKANNMAGKKWLGGFRNRRKEISLRTPEATSLARAMGFNKVVVKKFFDDLKKLLVRYDFPPQSIYNMDESGIKTVQDMTEKVLAKKGTKQVGQITSQERGVLVTLIGAMNAVGNAVPPLLVFPRHKFKASMIRGAPTGTKGCASPSGWSTQKIFVEWLHHFKEHVHASKESPCLLLMDNHTTHVSIESLDFAKDNGIVLFTFPPHCSHRLQPLDVSVFGPLKRYFNVECNTWLYNHPGQRVSIYEVAELLGKSFLKAFTPQNITSGFKAAGLYPLNENIFTEDDFLAAYSTDLPALNSEDEVDLNMESNSGTQTLAEVPTSREKVDLTHDDGVASPVMSLLANAAATVSNQNDFSPVEHFPFPKATIQPQSNRRKRKKGKSLVLTDTPVKNKLSIELMERSKGKKRKTKQENRTKKQIKKTTLDTSSDDDIVPLDDDSDDSLDIDDRLEEEKPKEVNVGDYVLVKILTTKSLHYYVGIVESFNEEDKEYNIHWMRRVKSKTFDTLTFTFPMEEEITAVTLEDIVLMLPDPTSIGTSSRSSNQFRFSYDLTEWNIALS